METQLLRKDQERIEAMSNLEIKQRAKEILVLKNESHGHQSDSENTLQTRTLSPPSDVEWNELTEVILEGCVEDVHEWFKVRGLGSSARQFYSTNCHWPLQTAAKRGNLDIFDALMSYGFDPYETEFFGDGPMHAAAYEGHEVIVKRLLDIGMSVSRLGYNDDTPLHCAASNPKDNSKMIKFLIKKRADVNCRNSYKETPLHKAVSSSSTHNVLALVDAGAYVNLEGVIPPLFLACQWSEQASVCRQILFDNGANVTSCPPRYCIMLRASNACNNLQLLNDLVRRNACMSCKFRRAVQSPLCNIVGWQDKAIREQACDLIIRAGYDIAKDFYWLKDLSQYPTDAIEKDVIQRHLLAYAMNPRSLRNICAIKIRQSLGASFHRNLDHLPLPETIKDVIRLPHI